MGRRGDIPGVAGAHPSGAMLRPFLTRMIRKNRAAILRESEHMSEFMRLLMKQRNTGEAWTPEDRTRLKSHVRHLLLYVPALILLLLPLGSLLLPLFAEILDRRGKLRRN